MAVSSPISEQIGESSMSKRMGRIKIFRGIRHESCYKAFRYRMNTQQYDVKLLYNIAAI